MKFVQTRPSDDSNVTGNRVAQIERANNSKWDKSSRLVAMSGFLCLLGISQAASATNYFQWAPVPTDQKTMAWPAKQPIPPLTGGANIDCTTSHRAGGCSMKMVVIGNDGGNDPIGFHGPDMTPVPYGWNIVGSRSLYYRWWMRIMPGFSWGTNNGKTKASRAQGIGQPQNYTGYLMSYGFLIGECGDGGCLTNTNAVNTDSNLYVPYDFTTKADGKWHEYIVRVKPNTSASCTAGVNCDAQLQAWVDGVSVGSNVGWKLHNNASDQMYESWAGWMAAPYWQLNGTSSDGGTIYVDDFSTDDSYNSVIGNAGAATQLSPPTSLRVVQ